MLEKYYFLSGIILAGVALFGLIQIWLNSQHTTHGKTIEFVERYLNRNQELLNIFIRECLKKNIASHYTGKLKNFSPGELSEDFIEFHRKRMDLKELWIPFLNDLQIISSAFVSGVADEDEGFNCIGMAFCEDVINQYDIISAANYIGNGHYYGNIIKLFNIWSLKSILLLEKRIPLEKNEQKKIVNRELLIVLKAHWELQPIGPNSFIKKILKKISNMLVKLTIFLAKEVDKRIGE